ncbi:hypothetical protein PM8797T_31573 [Gimesia maris DSM 8797]|nr:hypothetical protein PM8797T_31573 [Gimesia maris DSM 8797]
MIIDDLDWELEIFILTRFTSVRQNKININEMAVLCLND